MIQGYRTEHQPEGVTMTEIATPRILARYLDVTAVAKLVRKHLKVAFPAVKFSVKSDRYAGGSSIDIRYVDGPVPEAVRMAVAGFRGARFDGMIDLKYSAESWYCAEHGARTAATTGHSYAADDPKGTGEGNGIERSRCCAAAELVHFGADFIHEVRELSPEFQDDLKEVLAKRYDCVYDVNARADDEYMGTLLYRESIKTPR